MKDEDKTFENEVKHQIEDRGHNDLTLQIEMLTKQKELLQSKCKEAGALRVVIKDLQQEVYDLRIKNYSIVELENKIEVQKEIIKALSIK
tara:strand:+ start:872 stop:1141 length:270 start_codon:yes stop_codon:yes gene_type:complete